MKKEKIRTKFVDLRNQLSEHNIDIFSFKILENLKKLPIWDKDFYHIFLPISQKKEINTYPIIQYLWEKNKKVCLPKINFSENYLDCFLFEKETILKSNKYKIHEPFDSQKIDPKLVEVIFVPLLAFDLFGHRVGYGKGFYDQFFHRCKKEILKIGLSFFAPIAKIEDINKGDISLEICIIPDKNYIFKKKL